MESLAVIGNVSRDLTRYPDDRGGARLGGAAFLLSLAARAARTTCAAVGHSM
ncbi:hypothetical protein P3T29_000343 [Kitasatospora sp. MAP5-34]|nr:hypothetical protein [Kitasatospora sp. MAP5-34]